MSEDRPSSTPRGFFDRLLQALGSEPRDRDELIELLRDAQSRALFDADALAMIEGVLQVSEMQVRDIMIPRAQMTVVSRDANPEAILPVVTESGHSRFPVVGETRDEVVGILLAKDMLRYWAESEAAFNFRDVLRPAVFVPESKRLNVLLKEFRANRNHMAVVVDEYGGVAGLVTIEDVLEQIVGEIDDEHDIDEDDAIIRHAPGRFTVKARTSVEEFNDYFGTAFSDEEFDTIGGLVTQAIGHLPERGESVQLGEMTFKVLRADGRRVYLLRVTLNGADD
ncbi:MAG: CBS domain-containing protein [Chromatiales bacterium]|nr:CBS domain-containing protein [Gammaproteobacteria bacterium]MCP5352154.1 CBS domain-containing protein [Chromatiales bacterium]